MAKDVTGKFGELIHTSKLKSTPPIGAPNATEIPAAAAADNISRFLAAYQSVLRTKNMCAGLVTYLRSY